MVGEIVLPVVECKRCGHKWVPRVAQPAKCPKCRSPYWNKERRQKSNDDSKTH